MESIKEVLQSGKEKELEFPFYSAKRSGMRWGQARLVPEFDSSGVIVSVLSIGRDLTESKRMEKELREQKDFQQILLNALNEVGIQMMLVENGVIEYVLNRKYFYEGGYTDGEIDAGIKLSDLIHPDDRAEAMDRHLRRLAGENVPGSFELSLISRFGERREFETSVAVVPGTNPVRVVTIGKEITKRKQAEQQLRMREVEFRRQVQFQQSLLTGLRNAGIILVVVEMAILSIPMITTWAAN